MFRLWVQEHHGNRSDGSLSKHGNVSLLDKLFPFDSLRSNDCNPTTFLVWSRKRPPQGDIISIILFFNLSGMHSTHMHCLLRGCSWCQAWWFKWQRISFHFKGWWACAPFVVSKALKMDCKRRGDPKRKWYFALVTKTLWSGLLQLVLSVLNDF